MPQEINQEQFNSPVELTSDEAAAALGLATRISEQLLPKQPQTQEKGAKGDLEQKNDVDTTKEEKVDLEANNKEMDKKSMPEEKNEKKEDNKEIEKLTKGFSEFRDEIKSMIKDKFDNLSKTIKNAIEKD